MDTDLDTLATALYVVTDDLLVDHPERLPPRPAVGIAPRISDAELCTLAVLQALLGFTSEHRWLRYAHRHLLGMFPHLPGQPGLQQAAAPAGRHDGLAGRPARRRHLDRRRHRLGGRLDPGGVWPLARDRATLRPGRLGRVRLLRLPHPLLLGSAAAPGLHPARPAGRLGADRRESRRTARPDRHPHRHPGVWPTGSGRP